MSQLRRLRLAWGGWELAVVLVWLGLLGLLTWLRLDAAGGDLPTVAERPFAVLLLVAMPLGLRLRGLLAADGLIMARGHASWVLRWFCLVILPIMALAIAGSLVLIGIPPLWSLALAAALAAVGAWIGFSVFRSIPAYAAAAVLITLLDPVTVCSGRLGDALAVGSLIVVGSGVWLAWRRLEARSVPARAHWRWQRLDHLSAWFDACVMRPPAYAGARGRMPDLLTAIRVGLSGLGGSWPLRLIGMLAMAVGAFVLSSQASDLGDRLPAALCVTTLIACVAVPGWLAVGRAEDRSGPEGARSLVRGLLAAHRLYPLSRRLAAAATLSSHICNGLSNVLPLIAGMLAGLVLSDAWQGRESAGLWMILPQTGAGTACSASGVLLLMIVPIPAFIIGSVACGSLFLCGVLIMPPAPGSDATQLMLAISVALALALVPLAWWRLAQAELP